ncbi:hypothetical protein EDC94DRAFT_660003 [Helicostylum pulchrum]|nr:hypothetical protein EDC94DRAFT_660003 [Helicostylum pulchrum]
MRKIIPERANCYSNITKEFEAITCQCITYRKGTFTTPKERSRTAGFSKLLVAVVSLKRLVFNNYAVLEAKQTYEIQTMQFEEEDELNLASDSTEGGLDGN